MIKTLAIAALILVLDHGQYGPVDPALRGWFNGLRNAQGGQCCSFADGVSIADPDWDTSDNHYRVFLKGEWREVPPEAVVLGANRIGHAVVWPTSDVMGTLQIRCFMPGATG